MDKQANNDLMQEALDRLANTKPSQSWCYVEGVE